MTPEFRPVSSFRRGTLYALLRDAYGFDRRFALHWEAEWRNFDVRNRTLRIRLGTENGFFPIPAPGKRAFPFQLIEEPRQWR